MFNSSSNPLKIFSGLVSGTQITCLLPLLYNSFNVTETFCLNSSLFARPLRA